MNKKAQTTMTLEELVKMILGFMMFILILSFLVVIFMSLTSKTPSTYENDVLRVKKDLESLRGGDVDIIIPIFTKDITFSYVHSVNGMITCPKDKHCLCYKYSTREKCEQLDLQDKIADSNKQSSTSYTSIDHFIHLQVQNQKIEFVR